MAFRRSGVRFPSAPPGIIKRLSIEIQPNDTSCDRQGLVWGFIEAGTSRDGFVLFLLCSTLFLIVPRCPTGPVCALPSQTKSLRPFPSRFGMTDASACVTATRYGADHLGPTCPAFGGVRLRGDVGASRDIGDYVEHADARSRLNRSGIAQSSPRKQTPLNGRFAPDMHFSVDARGGNWRTSQSQLSK